MNSGFLSLPERVKCGEKPGIYSEPLERKVPSKIGRKKLSPILALLVFNKSGGVAKKHCKNGQRFRAAAYSQYRKYLPPMTIVTLLYCI
ncbi:hypothetical protein CEXT_247661 [Caerostris extrusa]|uniref:Uncharacterized protein n=1 Tax=Caerostris extrusa TaxID=172846 RepID=A0AAV4M391_CAEEX|nr:hypothetical protein CEXT_247661 [Caerostris extrusa]